MASLGKKPVICYQHETLLMKMRNYDREYITIPFCTDERKLLVELQSQVVRLQKVCK
eukprot:gene20080-7155_t